MRGQLYRLIMSDDVATNAQPGQFVYLGNGEQPVVGFVSAVDHTAFEIEMCLFDQSELPDEAIVLRETMTMDECSDLLTIALDQNPDMKLEWSGLINDSLTPRH